MSIASTLSDVLPESAVLEPGSVWTDHGHPPVLELSPTSTAEVVDVLEWARREGVGVLPVGFGARARPVGAGTDWVALRTGALTGIEHYEPADLTLTAGAGTRMSEVDAALRENDQWCPFDPPAFLERSLGGLVADAPPGPLWAGYGALRNHVLGATVVTGDGRTLRLGGRVVKNVAGYDLLRAIVGSRGRLAVITSVCVRAFPVPMEDRMLIASGPSAGPLYELGLRIATAPVQPVSAVVATGVDAIDGRSALVVRLHGAPATVDADQRTLERHAGRGFETLEAAGSGRALVEELRDRVGSADRQVLVSVLPTALHETLTGIDALPGVRLLADAMSGTVRVFGPALDEGIVADLRAAAERRNGASRVVRWDGGRWPDGTAVEPGTAALTGRLTDVFDPEAVLWPART